MTVRVNKSAFNIREKLSELERPIGVKGNELMRAETAQEAGALLGVGRKNAIINGDFRIAQRSTDTGTISLTTLNEYKSVDRQSDYSYNLSGTFTPQYRIRQYGDHPVSGAQGYCLRYDCISADTPATNVDFLTTYQPIEANNAINFYNNYLSLSFWVKSNKTGPYTVQLRANGAVSSPTPNSMWKYYVNSADVWEYKTILISPQNLSLITAGNGAGYNLFFHLASGQNKSYDSNIAVAENKWGLYSSNGIAFTDQTNLMSNAGNYWQVTNIQLEIGKVATEFEHRSYGEELALCQRYFVKYYPSNQEWIYVEGGGATNQRWWFCPVPPGMRSQPSPYFAGTWTGSIFGGNSITAVSNAGTENGSGAGYGRMSVRVTTNNTNYTSNTVVHTDAWAGGNAYVEFASEL